MTWLWTLAVVCAALAGVFKKRKYGIELNSINKIKKRKKKKKRVSRDPRARWAKFFVVLLVAVHDQSGTIRVFQKKRFQPWMK